MAEAEHKYTLKRRIDLQGIATLNEGPFATLAGAPLVTLNFMEPGQWPFIRDQMLQHRFLESIYDYGFYGCDLEHWGVQSAQYQKLDNDDVKRAISILHIKAPNGVLLQIQVNFPGKGKPKIALPQEIKMLLSQESPVRFGFGAAGDTNRLLASGLVDVVAPAADMHNLALIMWPQTGVALEAIRTGKDFAAEQLGAHRHFVHFRHRKTTQQTVARHDIWQFNLPIERWADQKAIMIEYNHYDHSVAYVALYRAAMRLNKLAGYPDADVIRTVHFLLFLLLRWKNRAESQNKQEAFLRPYPDWYGKDHLQSLNGTVPMPPAPMMPNKRVWNEMGTIMRLFFRQPRTYIIDRHGMPAAFVQKMCELLGGEAIAKDAPRARDNLYLNQEGACFPHFCERCGSTEHPMVECQEANVQCWYCQGRSHDIKVCDLLHRFCKSCFLRGHRDTDHVRPIIELWNKFMLASRCGAVTTRLQAGPVGYHYFEANGLRHEEAIPRDAAVKAYLVGFVGDIFEDEEPPNRGPDGRMRSPSPPPPQPGGTVVQGTTPTQHAIQRTVPFAPRGPRTAPPRPGPPPTRRLQDEPNPMLFPNSPQRLIGPPRARMLLDCPPVARTPKRERETGHDLQAERDMPGEADVQLVQVGSSPRPTKRISLQQYFTERNSAQDAASDAKIKPEGTPMEVDQGEGKTELVGDEPALEELVAEVEVEPEDVELLQQQDQLLALDEDDLSPPSPVPEADAGGG